jgi:hypothetical protein
MHLPEKVRKANHQSQCGPCEDHTHEPLQLNAKKYFYEERRDHCAYEQRGESAGCNCCACQVTPALEAMELELDSLPVLQLGRGRVFGELATSINDSGEAPGHDVENARNSGQQEDRRQRELYGVRDITDVDSRV